MNTRLWVAAPVLAIGTAIAGAMALGLDGPAASAAEPQVQGQDPRLRSGRAPPRSTIRPNWP